jgi:hypothetical protein
MREALIPPRFSNSFTMSLRRGHHVTPASGRLVTAALVARVKKGLSPAHSHHCRPRLPVPRLAVSPTSSSLAHAGNLSSLS